MKRKKLISITISSILIPTLSPITIIACSSNSLQNDANYWYKKIWNEVNNANLGNAALYCNSIYDIDSFRKNTGANTIKNIPQNLFNVVLDEFDYSRSKDGIIKFKVILKDKKTNQIFFPTRNEGTEEFFSNVVSICGFKPLDATLENELNNAYQQLNNHSFELNSAGIENVLTNGFNIKENINFDDEQNKNYLLKLLELPVLSGINNLQISNVWINNNICNAIEVDEINKLISLNFWIQVALKTDPNNPLVIDFNSQKMHQIKINYQPFFNTSLDAKDLGLSLKTATEAADLIKQYGAAKWIIDNKTKLFIKSSIPLIQVNKIQNIKINPVVIDHANNTIDNKSLEIEFTFVVNNDIQYTTKTIIIGFKA